MTQSNAGPCPGGRHCTCPPDPPVWPEVAEAIEHIRAADLALCQVVAAISAARGWREGEPYEATPLEQWWHDRIHELGVLRDRLQDRG